MMRRERFLVIMAGGRGERFWPQSRLSRPKHLLPIVGDAPMLTQTVARCGAVVPAPNVIVITNREQVDGVRECLPDLPAENVIAEPVGRDTAAAVGLAWLLVQRRNPDGVFAMLPADHVIHDSAGFQRCLERAFTVAENHPVLCTIGIEPTFPATGYGYVEKGAPLGDVDDGANRVLRFVEKPDAATASRYLEQGGFYWNAGMFFWTTATIGAALHHHTPDLYGGLESLSQALNEGETLEAALDRIYPQLEKISIDYAVMQKADNVAMVPSTFDWDDVGAWPAVARHLPTDDAGNVIRGKALVHEGRGNIVIGTGERAVVVVGADDLIVVETPDATLVCPRDKAESIKQAIRKFSDREDWTHLL